MTDSADQAPIATAAPTAVASLAIAVAQFAPGDDKAANLEQIRDLATAAASRGAKLVVFPEYSSHFTPRLGERSVAAAETLDGSFVTGLEVIAKVLEIHVVAGLLETTDDDNRFSNTLVAVDPHGAVVARYRKLHLYDAFGEKESDWVLPGEIENPETFAVGDFTVALQTCYDLRFPEVTRRLVDAGANLILVPSEWVRGPLKEAHWRTLLTARAIENTVYLAAADHPAPVGVGNSMILDPMGVELATVGEERGVAVAWISTERLDAVRILNPALSLRRFGVTLR